MRDSLMQLTLVRIREFWREPEAVFWALFFPILLSVGLGIAFRNRPPETVHVAVIGSAGRAHETLQALRRDSAVAPESLGVADARMALRTGRIALLVSVGEDGKVEYEYDDTRPDSRIARLLVDDAIQRAGGRGDPVTVAERHVREPGSRYIDFVVPGLLGMGLMGNGIWLVGFGVVDARKRKLLKRLMATPMSRAEYLASFGIPRLMLAVIEVGLLIAFATLAFGVPMRGSVWQFLLICLLSTVAFVTLGLMIAARPRTIEGASGLMNLAIVPMWIFSGVFFSSENFPNAIQPFIQALPLTAVNDALRANMLRGAGWETIGPELAIIFAWGVVGFVLALKLFRWR
jgi:ABC-2 type transport system permease protein